MSLYQINFVSIFRQITFYHIKKLLLWRKLIFQKFILKTINDVKQKNANNPKQKTAHPNVFDLIKDKIGGLDKKIQDNRAKKGKSPISILDLIKNQIEAARQHNQKDPATPTADSNIFDSILNPTLSH